MKKLVIEETEFTPYIELDAQERNFVFKGVSRPENVTLFYEPVIEWLKLYESEYLKLPEEMYSAIPLRVMFHFSYFNSATSKMLLQILEYFADLRRHGFNLIIEFYYDEGDDQMREDGEDFSEAIGVPFKFVEDK
jgi:hypothetical protein